MISTATSNLQSWTGSESQRRPQGLCPPPHHEPNTTPRMLVPKGTAGHVKRVDQTRWMPYTTTRDVGFARYEYIGKGCFVFRLEAWQLKVRAAAVQRNCR